MPAKGKVKEDILLLLLLSCPAFIFMQVHINHQTFTLPDEHPVPVTQLLQHAGITQHNGIALAINNQVIPRNHWHEHLIQPDDAVILITATQGG